MAPTNLLAPKAPVLTGNFDPELQSIVVTIAPYPLSSEFSGIAVPKYMGITSTDLPAALIPGQNPGKTFYYEDVLYKNIINNNNKYVLPFSKDKLVPGRSYTINFCGWLQAPTGNYLISPGTPVTVTIPLTSTMAPTTMVPTTMRPTTRAEAEARLDKVNASIEYNYKFGWVPSNSAEVRSLTEEKQTLMAQLGVTASRAERLAELDKANANMKYLTGLGFGPGSSNAAYNNAAAVQKSLMAELGVTFAPPSTMAPTTMLPTTKTVPWMAPTTVKAETTMAPTKAETTMVATTMAPTTQKPTSLQSALESANADLKYLADLGILPSSGNVAFNKAYARQQTLLKELSMTPAPTKKKSKKHIVPIKLEASLEADSNYIFNISGTKVDASGNPIISEVKHKMRESGIKITSPKMESRSTLGVTMESRPTLGVTMESRPKLGVTMESRPTLGVTMESRPKLGVTMESRPTLGVTTFGVTTSGVTTSGVTTSGVTTSGVTTSGVTTSGVTSMRPKVAETTAEAILKAAKLEVSLSATGVPKTVEATKKSTKKLSKKPTKKSSKKPTKKSSKKPTKKSSKKPTKKSSKKPTKKSSKKPTKKVSKKVSKKPTKKASKKPTKKASKKMSKARAQKLAAEKFENVSESKTYFTREMLFLIFVQIIIISLLISYLNCKK